MYAKIINGEINDILQMIEALIVDNLIVYNYSSEKVSWDSTAVLWCCALNFELSSHAPSHVLQEYLNIRSLSTKSAVCCLVRTLARFMARYFTNDELYVFPSHNPLPLPSLHTQCVISKY